MYLCGKGPAVLHYQWTLAVQWGRLLLFINVFDHYTVLLSLEKIWMYIFLPFYKDVIRKSDPRCVLCVFFHRFYSTCLMWCKSRDVCPYFYFQHHHLGRLYCPNFSSSYFFFSSAAIPGQPYHIPPPPLSLPQMVLSWGFSMLWWRAAGEGEELL